MGGCMGAVLVLYWGLYGGCLPAWSLKTSSAVAPGPVLADRSGPAAPSGLSSDRLLCGCLMRGDLHIEVAKNRMKIRNYAAFLDFFQKSLTYV